MGKPANWFWNSTSQQWEIRNRSDLAIGIGEGGIQSALTASFANLNVGSTLSLESLKVTGVGTIEDMNVGSTAVIEDLAVAGQGTIANLEADVGTITDLNVGTLATADALRVGSGASVAFIHSFIGSSALITGLGTLIHAVATIAIAAGADLAVGDRVFGNPKAGAGLGPRISVGPFRVPSINTLNVDIANLDPDSAGSFPAVGWDLTVMRSV